jgi:thiol-disulfide isomerase/thioredoxin
MLLSDDVVAFSHPASRFNHSRTNHQITMIIRPTTRVGRIFGLRVLPISTKRTFLAGGSSAPTNQNRVFDNIRQPNDLHTLTLLSATSNRPLITLWSASWCSTCQTVKPLVKSLIEDERVGEAEGGLAFAEVELDSTLIGDLGIKYMVRRSDSWKLHYLVY